MEKKIGKEKDSAYTVNLCDNSGVRWGGGGLSPQSAPPRIRHCTVYADTHMHLARPYLDIGCLKAIAILTHSSLHAQQCYRSS